jgi:hypothetical protein
MMRARVQQTEIAEQTTISRNPTGPRRCLDAGEALLRKHADQTSLAVLLCSRAEACHRAGEAATIAAELDSEIGQALEPVRRRLSTPD